MPSRSVNDVNVSIKGFGFLALPNMRAAGRVFDAVSLRSIGALLVLPPNDRDNVD